MHSVHCNERCSLVFIVIVEKLTKELVPMLRAKRVLLEASSLYEKKSSNWKDADCNRAQCRSTAKWDGGLSKMLAEVVGDSKSNV